MTPLRTALLLCLSLIAIPYQAMAGTTLYKLSKSIETDTLQVYLTLSQVPRHSVKITGKKLDISLEATVLASETEFFDTDDKVIKIVPSNNKGNETISLYFRYPPQDAKIEPTKDGKLVVTVDLFKGQNKNLQEINEKLKGLATVEQRTIDYANPLTVSPYAADWTTFFSKFEGKVEIFPPIAFVSTPFPIIALLPPNQEKNLSLLSSEIRDTAQQNLFDAVIPAILDKLNSEHDEEKQKLLALTYGEALLRAKNFEGAYKQLYLLAEKYTKDQVGLFAKYLLNRLRAEFQEPALAEAELRELEGQILPTNPLAPYFRILQIETALAAKNYRRVKELLDKGDVGLPEKLERMQELHRGDYLAATGNTVHAYITLQLLKDSELFLSQPSSLNTYCAIMYNTHRYQEAASCYEKLEEAITNSTTIGMVNYRKNMALLHIKNGTSMADVFAHLEDAFPESEAGYRGALKNLDLRYLENHDYAETAAWRYHELSEVDTNREVVAEAKFKEALIRSLLQQDSATIEILTDFLRDFQISECRNSAFALLVQTVPKEIKRLVGENKYMEALVLAKQNHLLFERRWIDIRILADLARSYQKIGIFSEARRLYQYLMEMVDEQEKHLYYLPLIQSSFDQKEYGMVDDYASQYLYKYPTGKDASAVLVLHLKALEALGNSKKALEILPKNLPADTELRLLAASLYFQANDFKKVAALLKEVTPEPNKLPASSRFMLAESLFQLKDYAAAAEIFPLLENQDLYTEQAFFREAEIERKKGNEEMALKIFRRIVEKGKAGVWKKYAEQELEYSSLLKKSKKP